MGKWHTYQRKSRAAKPLMFGKRNDGTIDYTGPVNFKIKLENFVNDRSRIA